MPITSPTRRERAVLLSLLLASIGAAGCASASGGGSDGSAGAGDVITQEQIDQFDGETAYDLVQRYRSRWLRPARNQNATGQRTTGSVTGSPDGDALPGQSVLPTVFLDGRPFGPIESLRGVPPRSLASIEFVSARSATTLYGTGYPAGIIEMHSR